MRWKLICIEIGVIEEIRDTDEKSKNAESVLRTCNTTEGKKEKKTSDNQPPLVLVLKVKMGLGLFGAM